MNVDVAPDVYKKIQDLDPNTRDVILYVLEDIEAKSRLITLGRDEFVDLKRIVQRLAEAQERLAEAQERTEQRVESLAKAQERTEQRVEELAEAQERLTEAQNRTEQRVEELTVSQNQLAQEVKALAAAQQRTENVVRTLVEEFKDLREQFGAMNMNIGYGLEDRLMPHLPRFAAVEFNLVARVVDRRNVIYPDGRYDEVNLYVEGEQAGQPTYLIGECKAQPGKKNFNDFARMLERLRRHLGAPVLGLMIGYQFAPEVEQYAAECHPDIRRYRTFEIERIAASASAALNPTLPGKAV